MVTRALRWLFDHRADLLAALVYGCLVYLSFNALADYANSHHLFPQPQGGWAFAVAVDGAVLYAFISFKRAPVMAAVLLVAGAATTYTLQRWHAQEALHPLWVAGVVPGAMILVTFAWHRIRMRPDWNVPPPPKPEPSKPAEPEPVPAVRPSSTQDTARRERPVGEGRPTPGQQVKIRDLVSQDPKLKARGIWREHFPGMTESWYRTKLIPFVAEVKGELVPISRNGDRP